MSTLPGNPNAARANAQKADFAIPPPDDPSYELISVLSELAERQAAIAYEQRSATLLALYDHVRGWGEHTREQERAMLEQITSRLGTEGL